MYFISRDWAKPETAHEKYVASKLWSNVQARNNARFKLSKLRCRVLSIWTDVIQTKADDQV